MDYGRLWIVFEVIIAGITLLIPKLESSSKKMWVRFVLYKVGLKVSDVFVSGDISNDNLSIFNQNEDKATPFIKLLGNSKKSFYM